MTTRLLIGLVFFVTMFLINCNDKSSNPPMQKQQYSPGNPTLLSTNSPTKDEDPSAVITADGKIFVAWFSDRTGNGDIYIAMTSDGKTWTAPVRVTSNAGGEFNPSLYLDNSGVFHLAWFRWTAPYVGNIVYNTSADGLTWNQGSEESVTTTPNVDDWVPTLTQAPDSTLLVFFVSAKRNTSDITNDIYVARKRAGQSTWDSAQYLFDINSNFEHSHLPVAYGSDSIVTLAWVRYDTTEATPWLNPKSQLMYATSWDGLSWSATSYITNEAGNVVNLYPSLYVDAFDRLTVVWLSTRVGGTPTVFEIAMAFTSLYPIGIVQDTMLPAGYSHKIVPTSTPGVYFAVWVQGPDGSQDIYYRLFTR